MAIEFGPQIVSMTASGLITQYHCVALSADNTVVMCSGATDIVFGIAQETVTAAQATAGAPIAIAIGGTSKISAAESIAVGAWVGTDSAGQAVALAGGTADDAHAIGMMQDSPGAADVLGTCLIDRGYFIADNSS